MPDELLTALACDSCLAIFRLLVEVGAEVSVCDYAKETCPIFPRTVKGIHLGFMTRMVQPDSFIAVRNDSRARLVPAVRRALAL